MNRYKPPDDGMYHAGLIPGSDEAQRRGCICPVQITGLDHLRVDVRCPGVKAAKAPAIQGRIDHGTVDLIAEPFWHLRARRKLAELGRKPELSEIASAAGGDTDFGRALMIQYGYAVVMPSAPPGSRLEPGALAGQITPERLVLGELVKLAPESVGKGREAFDLRRWVQRHTARREAATLARKLFWRDSVAPMLRRMAARMRAGFGSPGTPS